MKALIALFLGELGLLQVSVNLTPTGNLLVALSCLIFHKNTDSWYFRDRVNLLKICILSPIGIRSYAYMFIALVTQSRVHGFVL